MNVIENELFETMGHTMKYLQRLRFVRDGARKVRLMQLLSENETLTVGQLAELTDVRPATVSRHLDYMEKDGLVTRTRSEEDARVVRIALTPAGEERLAESKRTDAAQVDAKDIIDGIFTPEEAEEYILLTKKLNEGLRQRLPAGPGHEGHRGRPERGHRPGPGAGRRIPREGGTEEVL